MYTFFTPLLSAHVAPTLLSNGGVWKGLQIGLPPVLNFGSDEMKKRVATSSVHLNMSGSSHLDLSENVVYPLNPMVNYHYPY